MATNATIAGMFGKDNGHDFKVINQRESEVEIEYLKDGRQAWFLDTRFEFDENGTLQLI